MKKLFFLSIIAISSFLQAEDIKNNAIQDLSSPAISVPDSNNKSLQYMQKLGGEKIWQFGEFDGVSSEFKQTSAPQDIQAAFGGSSIENAYMVCTIGQTKPQEIYAILPGPAEIYYHGKSNIPLRIKFDLPEVKNDNYTLVLALTDQDANLRSMLEVSLNGNLQAAQWMPAGKNQVAYGKPFGRHAFVQTALNNNDLKAGSNELILKLNNGGYISFDAMALVRLTDNLTQKAKSTNMLTGDSYITIDAMVRPVADSLSVELDKNGLVNLQPKLSPAYFEAEFTIELEQGDCALTYELPRDSRSSVWKISFQSKQQGTEISFVPTAMSRGAANIAIAPKGLLKGVIKQKEGTVECTIKDEKGAKVFECKGVYVPCQAGRLALASDNGGKVHSFTAKVLDQKQRKDLNAVKTNKIKSGITCKVSKDGKLYTLRNGRMELQVDTKDGINPNHLTDLATSKDFADGDYLWPDGKKPQLVSEPKLDTLADGSKKLILQGRLGELEITQSFTAPSDRPNTIHEQITIKNIGPTLKAAGSFACGFGKTLYNGKKWSDNIATDKLTPIPNRRNAFDGVLADYRFSDAACLTGELNGNSKGFNVWGADAWTWDFGGQILLITKYNRDAIEWSRLEPVWHNKGGEDNLSIRLGGAGQWFYSDPDGASQLQPGQSFEFGVTHFEVVKGDWKAGYYTHRAYLQSLGIKTPQNYQPRVHWNELYDVGCPILDDRSFFNHDLMRVEAAKAMEIGCETLYLDPGWDTGFASSIWATDRMGPMNEFVREMKDKYGLTVALHTPLGAWSVVEGYPEKALRMDAQGNRINDPKLMNNLCASSHQYVEAKAGYLLELCKNGIVFLMFDGAPVSGPCYDPNHGHTVPWPTRQEHHTACLKLCQKVHEKYPDVAIELHDPTHSAIKGSPVYVLYSLPGSFDELWGDEDMWQSMGDLLSGRGLALFYRRMAYDIPTYLHINLKIDNANAMTFWYYASVVQHLGMGGKHPDPAIWESHKQAMKTYMSLKQFYVHGAFYGLDETVHAHTLADKKISIINVFNFKDKPQTKTISFSLDEIGMPNEKIDAAGAAYTQKGKQVTLNVELPAYGHKLIKLTVEK